MTYHAARKMVFTPEGTTPEIIEEVLKGLRAHHDPHRRKWTPGTYLAGNDVDNLILVVGMTLNLGLLDLPRSQASATSSVSSSEPGSAT